MIQTASSFYYRHVLQPVEQVIIAVLYTSIRLPRTDVLLMMVLYFLQVHVCALTHTLLYSIWCNL